MLKSLLLLCFLLLPLCAYAGNQLTGHDSPYLAMHGEDPVAWRPWSAEALAQARQQNKLLFVSIGYFSCHWCHVMQRESFSNDTVAKILNENFISVKVDRELNPAIDAYLIDFVTRTRGSAGWPLNVFLTPDGHPLVGMTYLPKELFITLLGNLQQQWRQAPDYLRQAAAQAAEAIGNKAPKPEPVYKMEYGERYETILVQQAMELGDEMSGGFGEQTKFPMTPHLESLLSVYERLAIPLLKNFLTLTLDAMASQGMRDHLGGGFYRYTVDPDWQTPHFEKMLYDNALLASLYLRAAIILERPDYEAVARDTLDFMLRELMRPDGAMVASLSAVDDANVEGGYYLWEETTLEKILSHEELTLLQMIWGMQGHAALDAGHHAREVMSLGDAAKKMAVDKKLAKEYWGSARKKLLKVRSGRSLPVDNKRLAAWNGLALTALAEASRLKDGEKYRQAANRIRDYLVNVLWDGQRLWRAKGKAGELGQAGLEDYAFAAQGLLAWARLTGNKDDFGLVKRWVDDAWRRFHNATGWRLSDQMLLPTGFGVAMMSEGSMPSPAAVMLQVSLDVAERDGDRKLVARVRQALVAGHSQLAQEAFDYPSQVTLLAAHLSSD